MKGGQRATRGERARQSLLKDDARQRVMGDGGERVHRSKNSKVVVRVSLRNDLTNYL